MFQVLVHLFLSKISPSPLKCWHLPSLLQTVWMWYFLLQYIYSLCLCTFSCWINLIVIGGNGIKAWPFSSAELSVIPYCSLFFSVCRTTMFIFGSEQQCYLSHFCMSHFLLFHAGAFCDSAEWISDWSLLLLLLLLRPVGDSVIIVLQTI